LQQTSGDLSIPSGVPSSMMDQTGVVDPSRLAFDAEFLLLT